MHDFPAELDVFTLACLSACLSLCLVRTEAERLRTFCATLYALRYARDF